MMTANERRGLIGLAIVLAVAVILIISTRRSGGNVQVPGEIAISDSFSNAAEMQVKDSAFTKTDTINVKKRRKTKNKQSKKKYSPTVRNPLDSDEIVN